MVITYPKPTCIHETFLNKGNQRTQSLEKLICGPALCYNICVMKNRISI